MNKTDDIAPLEDYEGHWVTDLGAWFPGERVIYRGRDLLGQHSTLSWMALWLLGVTGRIPTDRQIRLFEGIWTISSSYPDPRLWNNRVAAIAGTARSSLGLALSAATCTSEATIYGHGPNYATALFLHNIKKRVNNGEALEQILNQVLRTRRKGKPGYGKNRQVSKTPGFGRPIVHGDERIQPLLDLAKSLGLADGSYVKLAFEIEKILLSKSKRLGMNIAGLAIALCLDQGLTPRQVYQYLLLCFSAGALPCAIDATEKKAGTLFPIPCRSLISAKHTKRKW